MRGRRSGWAAFFRLWLRAFGGLRHLILADTLFGPWCQGFREIGERIVERMKEYVEVFLKVMVA